MIHKRNLFFATLFIFISTLCAEPQGKHTSINQYLHAVSQNIKSLSPATINNNGTQKLNAGYYILTDTCNFSPLLLWQSSSSQQNWQDQTQPHCAIYITQNNTVIDLNDKTLTQKSASGSDFLLNNLVGIYIAPGVSNVTIKNGTISHFSGAGICIDKNCHNIVLENVCVSECGLSGVIIGYNPFSSEYSSVFDAVQQIADQNPVVPVDQFDQPIYPDQITTRDIFITNCSIGNSCGYYYTNKDDTNSWTVSHAIGLDVVDTQNLQITYSAFNKNSYNVEESLRTSTTHPARDYVANQTGHIGYGIRLIRCKNSTISNSQTSANSGWAAYGIYAQNCQSINLYNCSAKHMLADGHPFNYGALLPDGFYWESRHLGRCAGFYFADSSNCDFKNCIASNNHGTRQTAGFWFTKEHIVCAPADAIILANMTTTDISTQVDVTTSCDKVTITTTFGDINIPNFNEILSNPPVIGSGYTVPDTNLQIINYSSENNRCDNCISTYNTSDFLEAFGFVSNAGNNNLFTQCQADGNCSGIGYIDFDDSSGIEVFDTGVDAWSLVETPRYINSFTSRMLTQAAGFAFRSTRLPLVVWDADTKRYILYHNNNSSDLVFAATSIQDTDPTIYLLLEWPEAFSRIENCTSRYNNGGGAGSGCGIYLQGAAHCIISGNWVYGNKSNSSGTISYNTNGIAAQGGYGIFDINPQCSSLIINNCAYANQVIRPRIITSSFPSVITGLANAVEGANYLNYYTDESEQLPIVQGTIGDFSSFTQIAQFTNIEWNGPTTTTPYNIPIKAMYTPVPYIFILPI